MSDLIPNLPQLMGRLEEGSDAHAVAAAFDADTIETARASLERILEEWEGRHPRRCSRTSVFDRRPRAVTTPSSGRPGLVRPGLPPVRRTSAPSQRTGVPRAIRRRIHRADATQAVDNVEKNIAAAQGLLDQLGLF